MSDTITTITITIRVDIDENEHHRLHDRLALALEDGEMFRMVEHKAVRPVDANVQTRTGHLISTSAARSPRLQKAIKALPNATKRKS